MPGGIRLCAARRQPGLDRTGGLQMKMFSRSIIAAMAGVFLCGCGFLSAAHAASCSLSVTNVAFGSVDVTANAAVDTTATLSITVRASF